MKRICLISLLMTSCMTGSDHPVLDSLQEFANDKKTISDSPFVEAYIQFAGAASERWSGPDSVILHIVAREPGMARINLNPDWLSKSMVGMRYLAAINDKKEAVAQFGMTTEEARDRLLGLAQRVLEAEKNNHNAGDFIACFFPVNVWLVQQSGTILERRTCRGLGEMDQAVSQVFSDFVQSKYTQRKK